MTRQSLVYGTLVLLLASLINRILGFIYQILMIRLIQPEGVGLFNMVYPVYVLALVLATAGIPVAIAKLVAQEVAQNNLRGAYHILKVALAFITASSIFFTALLITSTPFLQEYIFPNPKAYYCFLTLTPAIIIVSLCSAFRGFFQGLQQMTPTAVTQVAEQIMRVTAGLIIAYFLLPYGIEYATIGISFGVVCGELVGFTFMLWIFLTRRPPTPAFIQHMPEPFASVSARIFNLATPVTLTRFVSTVLLSIEALLIPRRLQVSGMTISDATATYGQLAGIAETLLFTPGIVTISLATALVPAISDALAQKNLFLVRTRIEEALRLTMVTGLPAVVVFILLPTELCTLFFGYGEAGKILGILATGGTFLYLQQTTTGILQGLGWAGLPLKNLVISSLFKLTGIYYLTALPGIGIRGTALAMATGYIIMAALNYIDLKRITGLSLDLKYCLGKPLLAATMMAIVMWQARFYLFSLPLQLFTRFMGLFLLGATAYLILLIILKGIHLHDLNRLRSLFKLD